MSWTQGIITREDMGEAVAASFDADYHKRTGKPDRLEYITWFTADRSDAIAHFEGGRAFKVAEDVL